MAEYMSSEGNGELAGVVDEPEVDGPEAADEPISTALRDYSDKVPGDEGYNPIGAEVRFMEAKYGIRFQYHTKRGIEPIFKIHKGKKVLTLAPDAKTNGKQLQRREQFVTELNKFQKKAEEAVWILEG